MLHEKKEITLYLVRHGESEANAYPHKPRPRSYDSPLTKLGRFQASRAGKRFLKEGIIFDDIYSSTLKRAEQTCLIAADKLGYPGSKIIKAQALVERMREESLQQAGERFFWFIDDIINRADVQDKNTTVALFSHGIIIKCFLKHIMGFDESFIYRLALDNASISRLIYNHKYWFISSINDTAHLKYSR